MKQRETKFKFWDKKEKKWYKPEDYESLGWAMFSNDVNIIRCQFTGLKDKNSKEIYEGDIVKHKNFPNECKIIEWKGEGWDTISTGGCKLFYEIIGNIYENPNLIK